MRRPQRAVGDDHVDRPQVEAQRCVEPSGTNCPRACAWPLHSGAHAHPPQRCVRDAGIRSLRRRRACASRAFPSSARPFLQQRSGGYCAGAHLFPFRTEKLSPAAPMILHPCGKVGRRPPLTKTLTLSSVGVFCLYCGSAKNSGKPEFFYSYPLPFHRPITYLESSFFFMRLSNTPIYSSSL